MKPVENKKHTPKYYPIDIYKLDVVIHCDVGYDDGEGSVFTLTRHLPLDALRKGNLTKRGASISIGEINVGPKFFRTIRKRKG